ncbi:MAG: hypothetical protein Q7S40_33120 [Opitutaceae bacterium]|nr:hypothetical protein [Opitutaceae bacterium]
MLHLQKTPFILATSIPRGAAHRWGASGFRMAGLVFALAVSTVAEAQAVFVTRLETPPAGTYDPSLSLHFTATFSAPVVVTGRPRLTLRVGENIRHATAVTPLNSGGPTTSVTFEYAPAPVDRDDDGIVVTPAIDLAGGAIRGTDASPAELTFWSADTRGIRIGSQRPPVPRILGLTAPAETDRADSLLLCGTADGSSRVTVTLVDVGILGRTTAAENGAWALPYPRSLLTPGIHRLMATTQNSAGLVSAESAPLDITVRPGDAGAITR